MSSAGQFSEQPDISQILDLYIEHKDLSRVAELFGVSAETIRSWLKQLDIIMPSRKQIRKGVTVESLNGPEKLAAAQARLAASSHYSRVSAAEYLRTFDIWRECQQVSTTAEILNLGTRSVTQRLGAVGVKLRGGSGPNWLNTEEELTEIRRSLELKVEEAATMGPIFRYRLGSNGRLTTAQKLEALELYIELQSTCKVGERLGIHSSRVGTRIQSLGFKLRPVGKSSVRFEDVNDPAIIQTVLEKLRAEVARQQAQAQE